MSSKSKLFLAFAACFSIMLAACSGGGGGSTSSASASVEPPVTGLLAWNHGRTTNWHWYLNPEFPRPTGDFQTGFDELEESEQGDFTPTQDSLGRNYSTMPGILSHGNRLRESYASWDTPINGIGYLISTESDVDWIRENARTWSHFDYTRAAVRGIMMHGQYSSAFHAGIFTCLGANCSSSGVRAAIWGKRESPSTLQGNPGVVQRMRGDTNFNWLRRNGARATWRGAMSGSSLATGAALVGEAVVSYTVSDDTLGLEFSNVRQRDDGTGVVETTYSGPASFTWSRIAGDLENRNSDYQFWSTDCQYGACGLDVRFYGRNAEEVAGTFETEIPNDKLIGSFIAKR